MGVDAMWRVFVCALVAAAAAAAREINEDDQIRLPRLFHLDNYERCLGPRDGLYCMGTVRMSADKPSAAFNFIKDYSSDSQNFDRTLVHRGYCLSSRCPSKEVNRTLRFERCIEQQALSPGIRASLESISCKTHEDLRVKQRGMDTPQRIMLGVIVVILFFNVIGTLYHLATNGEGKSKLLKAWSIQSNFARLTATYEDGDPRLSALSPIQGVRVLLLSLVIMTHAAEIQYKVHLYNPEYFERVLQQSVTMLIRNGSALTQLFIVISNFLFAYSMLLYSKNSQKQLGLAQLPMCILHRLARIIPVHLLLVGFAATWWRQTGDGPQWELTVGAESDICRKKFWTHALFLHNFIYPDEHCLLPTWFLAVDMQLYIVAAFLTLYLMQKKKRQIPILATLFIASCVMNFALAYVNEWKSLLYIMVPENVRQTFRGISSFSQFYTAPWGSLPACFMGLLTAHVHFDLQEQGYKISKHKWFEWMFHLTLPLYMAWILAGNAILEHTTHVATAAYVAIERPSFALLAAFTLLGIANNIDGRLRRAWAWRGWATIGRMSLSIMMLHWLVNVYIVGTRRTLTEASVMSISSDMLGTMFWTTLLALPVTLLVESPILRSCTALLS
ncbi:O-acyltransferase like protein-like [Maniola jurtina]|uniref:O-acyltransferase like protein-like n=1 Tax=Maniola jurtina TaxID=191418 RepID=UPI001E68C6AC|nr:O-acyltransferase like protein-like [Maniola jurtina]